MDLESERLGDASMGSSNYSTDSSLGGSLDSISIENSLEDDSISVAASMVDHMSENSSFVGDSTKDDNISSSFYHVLSEDTAMAESEGNDKIPVPSDICCEVTSLIESGKSTSTTGDGSPRTDIIPILMEKYGEWSESVYREIYLGDISSHDSDCDPLIQYGSLRKLDFRQKMAFVSCL